jgi:hypothetical protein
MATFQKELDMPVKDLNVGDLVIFNGIRWFYIGESRLWNHVHGSIVVMPDQNICLYQTMEESPKE